MSFFNDFIANAEKDLGLIGTDIESVVKKIASGIALVEKDLTIAENWLAAEAPKVASAATDLETLAQVAAPLAGASPAVEAAIGAAVTITQAAAASMAAIGAANKASASVGQSAAVTDAAGVAAAYSTLKGASGSIATAASNLAGAIKTAI